MSEVKVIGVIGAGQMGRGIAQVGATSGFRVILNDLSQDLLVNSQNYIVAKLNKLLDKGKLTKLNVDESLSNLSISSNLNDLKDVDLIIEAVSEKKEIKFDLFKKLDDIVKDKAVFASNTSSISITELASQTKRPDRFAGMHFMNPVPVMALVEGIRGLETSDNTFNVVKSVSHEMGKTFVAVKDMPGFAVNRILMPMINEAIYTLYEGIATVEDIDISMKLGTNVPMGPLTLADFIGLDTCLAIMEVLYEGFSDSKYRPCPLLKQYVASGRLGRKVNKGFYDY